MTDITRGLRLLLLALFAIALPTAALAELEVRAGGRMWATVDDDGTVRVEHTEG